MLNGIKRENLRHLHYILDENDNVVPATFLEWMMMFAKDDRIIAKDTVGCASISTVFLGMDYNYSDEGPPIVFETMIFGWHNDEYQTRCSTKEQALQQHQDAILLLLSEIKKVNN